MALRTRCSARLLVGSMLLLAPACTPKHSPASHAASAGVPAQGGGADGAATAATPSNQVPAAAGSPHSTTPSARAKGPESGTRSLPEVVITNVGMHIGGGPNDDDTKAPFRNAIEARFGELLRCYRLVSEPEKGGTFGVDLFIDREGGHPDVRQPRTALGGQDFRDCVIEAFRSVEFERPQLGPTVVSYSIRFSMEERRVP